MDGILPIIVVIISILSAFAKMQKKAKPFTKRKTVSSAPAPAEAVPPPTSTVAVQNPVPMFQRTPAPAVIGPEGEDACHEYMLEDEQEEATPALEAESRPVWAQDLVKGVIIGEILSRPRGYGRRRA